MRLIVPGWYGVAWVKWLSSIELQDRRFMNRFMGRDYVTIRGEQHGDQVVWRETSVSRLNPKSIIASVVKKRTAVWGSMARPGRTSADRNRSKCKLTAVRGCPPNWKRTTPAGCRGRSFIGLERRGTGRAYARQPGDRQFRRTQPAKDDPQIKLKKTYWEANEQFPRKVKV